MEQTDKAKPLLPQVFGGAAVALVLGWSLLWWKTPAWLDAVLLILVVVLGGIGWISRPKAGVEGNGDEHEDASKASESQKVDG